MLGEKWSIRSQEYRGTLFRQAVLSAHKLWALHALTRQRSHGQLHALATLPHTKKTHFISNVDQPTGPLQTWQTDRQIISACQRLADRQTDNISLPEISPGYLAGSQPLYLLNHSVCGSYGPKLYWHYNFSVDCLFWNVVKYYAAVPGCKVQIRKAPPHWVYFIQFGQTLCERYHVVTCCSWLVAVSVQFYPTARLLWSQSLAEL